MKIAVILAAGIGSRLRPLTLEKPKCMVRAAGKPILEHQLDAYEMAGFDRIIVIGGFRIDVLRAWLALRPSRIAVELVENRDFDTTNNMYSLSLVANELAGQSFYLSNGDVVFDSSIVEKVVATAEQNSVITVDASCFIEESMKVVMGPSGLMKGLSKAYKADQAHAVSIDLYRFSAKTSVQLFDKIKELVTVRNEKFHWTEVAIHEILQTEKHDFVPVDIAPRPWVEVDNLEDLAQADLLFSQARLDIQKAKAFIFDLDGTLIMDGKALPGALDTVKALQAKHLVRFCTNNSSRSRAEYAASLTAFGLTCAADDIVSSVGATIRFLRNRAIRSVFVLGTPSLKEELEQAGFKVTSDTPDLIVVGFDKTLTFDAVSQTTILIASGVPYILTHPDVACPTNDGPVPDAGAIAAMLITATEIRPIAVLGKPSTEMLLPLFEEQGLNPEDVVMIGDRLMTDMLMARNAGCLSVLVLTGITTRIDVEQSEVVPSLIAKSVASLGTLFQ